MSRTSRLWDSIDRIHQTLDALDERTEVLERFLSSEGLDEVKDQVARERGERKRREAELEQLEQGREKLRRLIDDIFKARSILVEYLEIDVVEIDGRIYEIRDGKAVHPSVPYGMIALDNKAKHAGLMGLCDLMDKGLIRGKLATWNKAFDPGELEGLKERVGSLSREDVDALHGGLEERREAFSSSDGKAEQDSGPGGVNHGA